MKPTVVITGAAGGIGAVAVQAFAGDGWNVVAMVPPGCTEEHAFGQTISVVRCDVTSDDEVGVFFRGLAVPVTAIVHLVGGIVPASPIAATTSEQVQRMLTMNFTSAFNIARHGTPCMQGAEGGSFVMIAARDVLHPAPNRAAYATSKAAVAQLVSSIAEEGRTTGIRANAILPSIVRTAANLEWAEQGEEANWVTPEELAHAMLFLADPRCGVSGALLPMYGRIPF